MLAQRCARRAADCWRVFGEKLKCAVEGVGATESYLRGLELGAVTRLTTLLPGMVAQATLTAMRTQEVRDGRRCERYS